MAEDPQEHSKYFFIASFAVLTLASLFLLKSYLIAIINSMIIAYIFYPVYKRIKNVFKSGSLSSLFTIIIIILIVLVPSIFTARALINESLTLYKNVRDIDFSRFEEKLSGVIDLDIEVTKSLEENANKLLLSLARSSSDLLLTLPKKLFVIFIMLFMIFYLLKHGKEYFDYVKEHIPLKESHKKNIMLRFNNVIYACIYGITVTAIIQGIIGAIGLWIFGIESPVFWGLVMIILSMIPFVGPWIVWLPASIYKIATGDLFNGFGLLIYGIIIVSTIDNIIRPKIIGSRGKVHPVLILLGVFGGLEVFGLIGIIIGPLLLALMQVFIELYLLEKNIDRQKPIVKS